MPKGQNRRDASGVLVENLRRRLTLAKLYRRDAFDIAWDMLGEEKTLRNFYRTAESQSRFKAALAEADQEDFYREYWLPVAQLFREDREGAKTIERALAGLLDLQSGVRPVLVVDLSREQAKDLFWNDRIQMLVIKRLLDGLNQSTERYFKEGQSLNTLVVIDEAHRLAPRNVPREEEDAARSVRSVLVDAARTTRKYGLGWLFISQTLSSLDPEIIRQLRILFFGFGLGLGQEFQSLRELAGSSSTALDLYQTFRDPHSAFDVSSRQYSFMTTGPVSPLSFSGSPLFFNAFNTVSDLISANSLPYEIEN